MTSESSELEKMKDTEMGVGDIGAGIERCGHSRERRILTWVAGRKSRKASWKKRYLS